MTFDLEKFKAGQPALTRRGDKRYFVALVPEMHERFRLLVRPEKGMVIRFYDEQGRIGAGRSMDDMDSMYEEPPEPRQIDWSKIAGSSVPVQVRDFDDDKWDQGFLKHFYGEFLSPFRANVAYKQASLETGLWVFNDKGQNPWPEGVIIEVWVRHERRVTHPLINDAREFAWNTDNPDYDIIASRAVGLEDGWRY